MVRVVNRSFEVLMQGVSKNSENIFKKLQWFLDFQIYNECKELKIFEFKVLIIFY